MGFATIMSNPTAEPTTGQQTAVEAGTRLQVNNGNPVPMRYLARGIIRALPGNTGTIYVGGNEVGATTGMPLAAGEDLYDIKVDDLSKYYVWVVAADDGFAWLAEGG